MSSATLQRIMTIAEGWNLNRLAWYHPHHLRQSAGWFRIPSYPRTSPPTKSEQCTIFPPNSAQLAANLINYTHIKMNVLMFPIILKTSRCFCAFFLFLICSFSFSPCFSSLSLYRSVHGRMSCFLFLCSLIMKSWAAPLSLSINPCLLDPISRQRNALAEPTGLSSSLSNLPKGWREG